MFFVIDSARIPKGDRNSFSSNMYLRMRRNLFSSTMENSRRSPSPVVSSARDVAREIGALLDKPLHASLERRHLGEQCGIHGHHRE